MLLYKQLYENLNCFINIHKQFIRCWQMSYLSVYKCPIIIYYAIIKTYKMLNCINKSA